MIYAAPTEEDLARIPDALKALQQWVLWRGVWRPYPPVAGQKVTKVPINPYDLSAADSTDPSTWGSYAVCVAALPTALEEWQLNAGADFLGGGLGFVFADQDPFVGVDLDGCVDEVTGVIAPWAEEIVTRFNSYTEISQSSTGLHLIGEGTLPPRGRRKGAIEMYDTARFFTMTGWRLEDAPAIVHDATIAIHNLWCGLFGCQVGDTVWLLREDGTIAYPDAVTISRIDATVEFGTYAYFAEQGNFWPLARCEKATMLPDQGTARAMEDAAIVGHIKAASNAAKVLALASGNWAQDYPSQSEADMALCVHLAFWTRDPEQIDRLFRDSKLMRRKWDAPRGESTYGRLTIREALSRQNEYYTPPPTLVVSPASLNGAGYVWGSPSSNGSLAAAKEPWPAPQLLPDGLRTVPSMSAELLPEALKPWLADMAERLQVPLEFPAVGVVTGLGSVVGNQARIRPKERDDWTVTPNLWGAVVGPPGSMKSPALQEALKPLARLVKAAEDKHREAMKGWTFTKEAAHATLGATRDQMKQAAKKHESLERFRAILSQETPEEPTERRYIVNDATVEKLGELLNENRYGLLLFRDELTGWLRALEDERRANDRAFFLEAWNGDGAYTYDRIERGTIKIPVVTTSVLGGIQPGPLQTYLRGALGGGMGDDGLFQRLQLLVYPDLPHEWTYVDRWPETAAKNQAFAVFERLSTLHDCPFDGELDDDGRPLLRFARDAQTFFATWFAELQQKVRSGSLDHPALEAHLVKYASLMPSLALVFALADWAAGDEGTLPSQVSLVHAKQAAAWCDFLWAHAQRIYGLGLQDITMRARALARHLVAGDMSNEFTSREVYRRGWAGLSSAEDLVEPLALLEDLGWLRSQTRHTGGRPTTVYTVNPRIREGQP